MQNAIELTPAQAMIVHAPLDASIFAHGIAGRGKSTAGAARLRSLVSQGVSGDSILILTPQRTLLEPYLQVIRSPEIGAGTEVRPATIGGLARRLCDWFWPLCGAECGFAEPRRPPTFLTSESAQYHMALIVRPLLDQGYFDSVTMHRSRLYAQILDSLNKSAAVGFPHTEIGSRLDLAWSGEPTQRRIYADAQECASRFRRFCLEHNLLDFSLQLEVFWRCLWPHPQVREHLVRSYRHLIYDNVEEDVPLAHDLIREWLSHFSSAILIYDQDAGYRQFLGADVDTGWALREICQSEVVFPDSLVMSPQVAEVQDLFGAAIRSTAVPGKSSFVVPAPMPDGSALGLIRCRFYPELLDAVAQRVGSLLSSGRLAPSDVVLIAPYLSDALRFALTARLDAAAIPWQTYRPSRSLRDEPAARALLTLAAIAHPAWSIRPSVHDVAHAFMIALDLDLVRSRLLAQIVYRMREFDLSSFDQIHHDPQQRITLAIGGRYSRLRAWLAAYRQEAPVPLDHFLRKLFGEILSQPGFGLHGDLDGARVASNLVESARKFRLAMESSFGELQGATVDLGREYTTMLGEGILAAQYVDSQEGAAREAVLVAPAYSFLMMNRPATVQFWLDAGSDGWFQRLDQPLTHTAVLSRGWPQGRKWTYEDEDAANVHGMERLVLGLLRRCRQSVVVCSSDIGEAGFEQRGRLLEACQRMLA